MANTCKLSQHGIQDKCSYTGTFATWADSVYQALWACTGRPAVPIIAMPTTEMPSTAATIEMHPSTLPIWDIGIVFIQA